MPAKKHRHRSRNWCGTSFKVVTPAEIKAQYEKYEDVIRYWCLGKEVCPTSQREHWQFFIQTNEPKSLKSIQAICGMGKIHIEIMRGSAMANYKYCTKDGDMISFGLDKPYVQGRRTDIEDIKRMIDKGDSEEKCWDTHFGPMLRMYKGFNRYRFVRNQKVIPKWRDLSVHVLWGKTGTGKTRFAASKGGYFIHASNKLRWWDGYNNEEVLVIDDYSNDVQITWFMALLDGYQLRLETKGGFAWAAWTKVWITTNLSENELHQQARPMHRAALMRRITDFTHYE